MRKGRMLNVPFRASLVQKGNGWAWAIARGREAWRFCSWVAPTKEALLETGQPSPEARPCRVAIVPIRPSYLLADDEASGVDLRKWKTYAIDRLGIGPELIAEIDAAARAAPSETESER